MQARCDGVKEKGERNHQRNYYKSVHYPAAESVRETNRSHYGLWFGGGGGGCFCTIHEQALSMIFQAQFGESVTVQSHSPVLRCEDITVHATGSTR